MQAYTSYQLVITSYERNITHYGSIISYTQKEEADRIQTKLREQIQEQERKHGQLVAQLEGFRKSPTKHCKYFWLYLCEVNFLCLSYRRH